jgi:NTE family protein
VSFVARRSKSIPETALTRFFAKARDSGAARHFALPGGSTLYDAGEPADELYYLQAGRLGAFRREEGQEQQFLGVIRPGEPAGEMALVAGTPHSAAVVALRDSELLALPRAEFFKAADRAGGVMTELARLMILRARQTAKPDVLGAPSVFGFIAVDDGPPIRLLVDQIAAEAEKQGYSVAVAGVEAVDDRTERFSNLEAAHDFILYCAERDEKAWKAMVGRQVDRLFWVGHGERKPPREFIGHASDPLQAQRLVDLLLIQPASRRSPQGSEAWLDVSKAARIFHVRRNDKADIARIARVLTGQSVGLVLSGGGARAYAHVGAVRALREHGVPIDFVGGASMGAMVGAGVALGWDDAEMDRRMRKAFVTSSPISDIAFPFIAMTRGEEVRARLEEHFGETQIADLPLPFFCVSSNLTTGAYHLHRRGLLRRALRASIALPGVLPPVTEDADVLVDGAVIKNFPADVMRAFHLGAVVGVDVTRGRSITAADINNPPPLWRWLWSGKWRQGPPMVALLMRAATVSTGRDLAASREATDVLILPKVDRIDIRNWRAYEPAVAAGYQATNEALATLTAPVTELHRRKPRAAS